MYPSMKTLEEIKQILSAHKMALHERFHVRSLGIFGSIVRGDQLAESDVDILVEFDVPVGWEVVDLHQYLQDILGMKVDLVTKRALMAKPLLWQSVVEDLIYV